MHKLIISDVPPDPLNLAPYNARVAEITQRLLSAHKNWTVLDEKSLLAICEDPNSCTGKTYVLSEVLLPKIIAANRMHTTKMSTIICYLFVQSRRRDISLVIAGPPLDSLDKRIRYQLIESDIEYWKELQ